MTSRIKLVQGDTGPNIDVTLVYEDTGLPIDVSDPGDIVQMYFRKVGSTSLKSTLVASKPNGGADGFVRFPWGSTDLDEPGSFESEIEITFNTGVIYTIYDRLKFRVREQIG